MLLSIVDFDMAKHFFQIRLSLVDRQEKSYEDLVGSNFVMADS